MSQRFLPTLRVIESSAFIAAPLAGLALSQFGADVIRVDPIGGGIDYRRMPRMPSGRSLYWAGLNKGKRSVAVDIRSPAGRELVVALATAPATDASAGGVLLTNLGAPWLAHAVLAARRADIISCTVQGNGDGSTAVDYTVNSATGYPATTGGGSIERPVNHVMPAWDVACAYQAATAVLAAFHRRGATGEGAELKLALSDLAFATLSNLGVLAQAELLDEERPSIGNHLYGAFGHDFVTQDGRRLMLVAISAGQWAALVKGCGLVGQVQALEATLGRSLADEADRFEARDAIKAMLDPWFAARSYAEATAALDANRVLWGPYRTVRGLLADDARVGTGNPVFERHDAPGIGDHLVAGNPVRVTGSTPDATTPAPWLGTHTDAVLHDVLGLSSGAIGALHDAGTVAGPERDPMFRR